MLRSSILVTALAMLGSLFGFVVQLLLARQFGAGSEVDAYLFALSLPTFIAGMLAAMLSYSVVPRLVLYEKDQAYLRQYMATLLFGITLFAVAVSGLGLLFNPFQKMLLPAISPIRQHPDLTVLLVLGWGIAGSQIVQGYLVAALNSLRQHYWAAALGLLPYVGMLVFLLLRGRTGHVFVIAAGMLAGTIVSVIWALVRLRAWIFPVVLRKILWTELLRLVQSAPYTVLAMSCFSAYAVIDAYWAPKAGEGTLAALGYAQRLVIALGNLAVAGPSAVLVPKFAEYVRDQDFAGFRAFLLKSLLIVGGIASALALFLGLFAEPIIQLLFARGAFGAGDVLRVAQTLQNMLPGMVMMLMSVIGMRALFCLPGGERRAFISGLFWPVAYFLASLILYRGGGSGLAIGYSCSWFITCCLIFILAVRMPKDH